MTKVEPLEGRTVMYDGSYPLNPTYFKLGDRVRIYLARPEKGGYAVRDGVVIDNLAEVNGVGPGARAAEKTGLKIKLEMRGTIKEVPKDLSHPEQHQEPDMYERVSTCSRSYPYREILFGEKLVNN